MRISYGILLVLFASGPWPLGYAQGYKAEIEAHLQKARDAVAHHDLRAAIEEYREVLKLDPKNTAISTAFGITLYALGEPAQAIKPLQSSLAADPTQGEAETFLGLSLADLGQCREALPLLKRCFAAQLDSKVRRLIGLSLLGCSANSSSSDDAVDMARQLKKLYPDDPDVLYHVAELYSALSKETVNDLFQKHPDSFRVHELAGEALEAQNNDGQALIEYRKAVELNPKAPHLHYRIAAILLRAKKDTSDAQALEHFKQEILANPSDSPSEYQIAEILRRQNQLDAAFAHFLRALELNPVFVEAHLGLAKVHLSRHQANEAIVQLRAAVQLAPQDPAPHYSLMLAYRELGRMEDANREMAIVGDLNAKKRTEFNLSLHTLLTGQRDQQ
jgi:tetratricopeptide (TPR) repeat protein